MRTLQFAELLDSNDQFSVRKDSEPRVDTCFTDSLSAALTLQSTELLRAMVYCLPTRSTLVSYSSAGAQVTRVLE